MLFMRLFDAGTAADQILNAAGFDADHVADFTEVQPWLRTLHVVYLLAGRCLLTILHLILYL